MRVTGRILGFAILLACFACASPNENRPVEEFGPTAAYERVKPTEIAVHLPDAAPADALNAEAGHPELLVPAAQMREQMRQYLISRKSFAVPTSAYMDETMGQGGAAALATDALLEARIDRFDIAQLAGRGVVHVDASITLKDGKNQETLWTWVCKDRQVVVPAPHGGSALAGNLEAATKRLAEDALSRLPHK